ncbi:SMP-30/gluconolactonase/LRE family protein [Rhodanobacter sp. L36]|uniref:SMP-30/gluconolactonase/LRE family protein n=1 Tax=Rhodanobacter sp. L36 TaxID=1747221 RepID=UPI00131D8565|nr:SMP-30/gluconolactonase/LRE family protein [Rhodanobacter sp. L36]
MLQPVAFFLALASTRSFAATTAPTTVPLPPDWYPESVAVGPDGSFYVGSWRQGAVARIRSGSTMPQIVVKPGANGLANGQGVVVDAKRHLLWVCSGTLGFTTVPMTPSALKSYDLATGMPRASYVMPDKGYCNDMALDSHGTLYVTDSLHPRVLRLRIDDSTLQTWKEDPAFAQGKEGFDLNGIALDDDDNVYVSELTAAAYLWRISVQRDGMAGSAQRISMPRALKNADAIRYAGSGRLVIFESNAFGGDGPYGGQISLAILAGDRATSLTTLVHGLNDPSSGAIANGRIYFIESKYGILMSRKDHPAAIPKSVPFDVQSIPLP